MPSPTERTIELLKKAGIEIDHLDDCCERWLPGFPIKNPDGSPVLDDKGRPVIRPGKRRDLWGLFDYAVLIDLGADWNGPCSGEAVRILRDSVVTLGIQTTGMSHSEHKSKMLAAPKLAVAIRAGWIPLLISWRIVVRRRRKVKRPRVEAIYPKGSDTPRIAHDLVQRLIEIGDPL